MMESTPEIIGALLALAKGLEDLGLPGLIALLLLGPLMTVIAVFALDFLRRRAERHDAEDRRREAREDRELIREVVEKHRVDTSTLVEKQRGEISNLVEKHRSETSAVVRDLGEKHAEVAQYYKDNVELLKATQRITDDYRDIVLNNTRAVDHLTNAMQANFYCPAAREAATGKK